MVMTSKKILLSFLTYTLATVAHAGTNPPTPLPLIEGGLLTAGVIGLVIGIRIIKRKK